MSLEEASTKQTHHYTNLSISQSKLNINKSSLLLRNMDILKSKIYKSYLNAPSNVEEAKRLSSAKLSLLNNRRASNQYNRCQYIPITIHRHGNIDIPQSPLSLHPFDRMETDIACRDLSCVRVGFPSLAENRFQSRGRCVSLNWRT